MDAVEIVKAHLLATVPNIKTIGDEWRMNNPARPGSDSNGFYFNHVTGLYHDKVTGEGGNAVQLAKMLGIKLPERGKVETSKRAYRDLKEYAAHKGVPAEAFIRAGWSEDVQYIDNRPCTVFTTRTGKRYRFFDGNKPPFKSELGYKRCWYGLDKAIQLAQGKNLPLIVVNGEPSVIVAQFYGIPAFAMTSGEGNTVAPELMAELKSKWTGSLIVALDCDEAGKRGAEHYRRALTAAGYTFRIVDLGLEDHGDVADLCKLHTDAALDALLKCADMGVKPHIEVKPTLTLEDAVRELAIARKQENGRNIQQLIDRVQAEIDALRQPEYASMIKPIGMVLDEYQEWLELVNSNGGIIPGVPSGIDSLNEYLGGGFAYGTNTTFLAATNQGKSTLMASIASTLIDYAPGAIIGTETKGRSLINKIVAYRIGLSTSQIAKGETSPRKRETIQQIINFMRDEHIVFLDASNPTPKQVLETAKRSIEAHGCRWVIIDSLSNIGGDNSTEGIFDNVSGAADVASALAGMGLAVISTSQVGRSMKERKNKIPTMHDGKGSGRIEENADKVVGLYNHNNYVLRGECEPDDNFPPGTIMLRTVKDRDGELPTHGINLLFKGGIGVYDLDMKVETVYQAWREDKRAMENALPYTQIMLDRREQRENAHVISR